MSAPVLFDKLAIAAGKQIGVVTLNSEKTLNSLNLEMVDLMLDHLLQWQHDDSIVAVFFQAAGEKAFCAGGDVQALYKSSIEQPGGPCEYAEAFFEREYRLDYLIHTYAKPTIAWGHGIVMGGGLGVFSGCRYRIATEKTRIAMPEVTIALFPDVGGSYFLNHMPGLCGRFLALTAASINGVDGLYSGIANYVISHQHKQSVVDELTSVDWGSANCGAAVNQLLLRKQQESAGDMPAGNLEPHQAVIDELCAGDDLNAIAERFAALDTDDKWLQRAKSGFLSGSPLAIRWIFKQLTLCHGLPLNEVFQKEILLVTRIIRHTEFAEGVRALLIDKDNQPNWQFKELSAVTDETVERFFSAPWPNNPLADL